MGESESCECTKLTVSDWIIFLLSVTIFAVSLAAIFVPWTNYTVGVALMSGSPRNSTMDSQWPQMLYSRGFYLQQTCFPDMNETTWRGVFGREPKLCGKSANKCYCMTCSEYQKPVNGSTYQTSHEQQKLLGQYNAALGLLSLVIALSCLLALTPFFLACSPLVFGVTAFLLVLLEECSMVAVLILYCSAENLESTIVQPPHLGYIKTDKDINEATTVKHSHGFALCCALVALVTIQLVLYLCSWLPRILSKNKNKSGDGTVRWCQERCCCCAAPVDDMEFGIRANTGYGAVVD